MTLTRIKRILDKLAEISSRLEKEAYIQRHWDAELARVVEFAYNDAQYNMTDIPWSGGGDKVDDAFTFLETMSKKRGATDADRAKLAAMLPDADTADVITRILNKDLKCGCGIKTWEKFLPSLVKKHSVMLCIDDVDRFLKEINSDCSRIMSSIKLDGVRCSAIVNNGKVIYKSRNGKVWNNFNCFDKDILTLAEAMNCDEFDGEVLLKGGVFDDLMSQTRRLEKINNSQLEYNIFDAPGLGTLTLEERYKLLKTNFPKHGRIKLVEHWQGWKDIQQLFNALDHVVSKGAEGLVIKDRLSPYTRKRSSAWLKMKKFKSTELVVKGAQAGTGKYQGTLGALICDLNGVEVKVGSGYSDSQRDHFINNPPIGEMIEVKYFEVTKEKSLRFPIFLRLRDSDDL